jgi:hypothetical protein
MIILVSEILNVIQSRDRSPFETLRGIIFFGYSPRSYKLSMVQGPC